jgi:ribosomal protein L37AE/L43A
MTAAVTTWKVGVVGTGRHGSRYARHIIKDVDGLALSRHQPEIPAGANSGPAVVMPMAC